MTASRPLWPWLWACVPLLGACESAPVPDLSVLAEKPALQYSVLATGGAFIHGPGGLESGLGALARTFVLPEGQQEAFSLDELLAILKAARVFVAVERDSTAAALRQRLSDLEGPVPTADRDLCQLLDRARDSGHDFLLVLERVQDGPVESQGVNDRWPFTLGAWLFALGALIPDRTYESRARLQVSLREVQSGRRVYSELMLNAGPVDLNMFERCNLWGFIQSILVPPFWTSSDHGMVVATVRSVSTKRLMIELARRLKSVEVEAKLKSSGPASIQVRSQGGGLQVDVDAEEALRFVRMRIDLKGLASKAYDDFEAELLASVRRQAGRYLYTALLPSPPAGKKLQVLVQTVAARVGSVTLSLADL